MLYVFNTVVSWSKLHFVFSVFSLEEPERTCLILHTKCMSWLPNLISNTKEEKEMLNKAMNKIQWTFILMVYYSVFLTRQYSFCLWIWSKQWFAIAMISKDLSCIFSCTSMGSQEHVWCDNLPVSSRSNHFNSFWDVNLQFLFYSYQVFTLD